MTSSKPADVHDGIRNPGTALRPDWLEGLQVEPEAADRRVEEIRNRSTAEPGTAVARLLHAVRLLDLTTLAEDDTPADVRALCARARRPIGDDVLEAVGTSSGGIRVAAVCVFDRFVPVACQELGDSGIRVAAVTAGFPVGLPALPERLDQVRETVASGADEIDVVIHRQHVLGRDWRALYDEVRALREACGPARLKTILAAGDLGGLAAVAAAGLVCCMAGADFIKTSTGRERVNATLPIGLAMVSAIRRYAERTGYTVGIKPAGGMRTAADALAWLELIRGELGAAWMTPVHFRLGASSLLGDIERRIAELTIVTS